MPPKGRKLHVKLRHKIFSTKEERLVLLEALKRGVLPDDVDTLAELFPMRTKDEILMGVRWLCDRAQLPPRVPRVDAPIEHWLRFLEDLCSKVPDTSQLISKVMLHLQLFEGRQKLLNGPNVSALYNFLVALLSKKELPQLNSLEAATLLHCMDLLADILKTKDVADAGKAIIQKTRIIRRPDKTMNLMNIRYLRRQGLIAGLHRGWLDAGYVHTPELTVPNRVLPHIHERSSVHPPSAPAGKTTSSFAAASVPSVSTAPIATDVKNDESKFEITQTDAEITCKQTNERRSGRVIRPPDRWTADQERVFRRFYYGMELIPTPLYPLNPMCLLPEQVQLRRKATNNVEASDDDRTSDGLHVEPFALEHLDHKKNIEFESNTPHQMLMVNAEDNKEDQASLTGKSIGNPTVATTSQAPLKRPIVPISVDFVGEDQTPAHKRPRFDAS